MISSPPPPDPGNGSGMGVSDGSPKGDSTPGAVTGANGSPAGGSSVGAIIGSKGSLYASWSVIFIFSITLRVFRTTHHAGLVPRFAGRAKRGWSGDGRS